MYKKLSDWQQDRKRGLLDTRNTHGVDATVWKQPAATPVERPVPKLAQKPSLTDEEAIVELNKIRAELLDVNDQVQSSEARYNGRAPGAPLRGDEYNRLLRHKRELAKRKLGLESQLAVAKAARRSVARTEGEIKAATRKATIAETFMDLAKEMLADDVYQRVLIASVHRHRDKMEGAATA